MLKFFSSLQNWYFSGLIKLIMEYSGEGGKSVLDKNKSLIENAVKSF